MVTETKPCARTTKAFHSALDYLEVKTNHRSHRIRCRAGSRCALCSFANGVIICNIDRRRHRISCTFSTLNNLGT